MGNDPHPTRPTPAGIERKLAAILSADVQGFSRLMGADEEATLHTLHAYREVTDSLIQQHRGRFVGSAGDSVLAEFASVVDALQCAVAIQHELKRRNAELPAQRRMEFRIGINLGDVMVDGEQIYGDGVNIAARLQALADAGGICISGTVHEHVKNKLALRYEDLGEQQVKNIAEAVRVLKVVMEIPSPLMGEGQGEGATGRARAAKTPHPDLPPQGGKEPKKHRRVGTAHRTRAMLVLAGAVLILGGIGTVWYLSSPPIRTPQSALRNQAEPAPALPLPDKPSIVVLSFVNLSEDPKQEYFSDGLTEDLTSALSRLSGLFVISRTSAFTYKGKAVKAQEVSKELGVQYVLEGSVRKADGQVRITAQLIDATTDHHLWTEHYDRPLQDIFALQDEIVQKIVTTLKLQLTLMEQGIHGALVRKGTDNLEAYDFYLRGMASVLRAGTERKKEANVQARQLLEKAIELDPQYALVYVALGLTYFYDGFYQWNPDQIQLFERAIELAQRAITLDGSLSQPHLLLSRVYGWKKHDEQALAEAQQAVALDPNDSEGYRFLGEALGRAGRPEETIELTKKAMRLNPGGFQYVYLSNLGWAYRLTGQYAEAIAPLKKSVTLNPNFLPAHFNLAICYAELGREDEARAEVTEILRLEPDYSLERAKQQMPYKDPAVVERSLAGLRKAGLK
jgi:adenylate cyclase